MKIIFKCLTIAFLCIPALSFSHVGGLDKHGGHKDRKSGGYHCHRDPCKDAATSIKKPDKRYFPYVYRRKDWKHWSDFDKNCMNTRHEMLKDQADGPIHLSPEGCSVWVGIWNDPFSGKQFTLASDLDVDHVVPLKWASDHGGVSWSLKEKEQFANDPINLLVVDDGLNQFKGAKGPSKWMPPNESFRCDYIALWERVLEKYSTLIMNSKEKRIFTHQKNACIVSEKLK